MLSLFARSRQVRGIPRLSSPSLTAWLWLCGLLFAGWATAPSLATADEPASLDAAALQAALQCEPGTQPSNGHCCPAQTTWCHGACVATVSLPTGGNVKPPLAASGVSVNLAETQPRCDAAPTAQEALLGTPSAHRGDEWLLVIEVVFAGQPPGVVPGGSFLEINDVASSLGSPVVRRLMPGNTREARVRVLSRGYQTMARTIPAPSPPREPDPHRPGYPVSFVSLNLDFGPNLEVRVSTVDGRVAPPMALSIRSPSGVLTSCEAARGYCQLSLPPDAEPPLQLTGQAQSGFAIALARAHDLRRIDIKFDRKPWPWGGIAFGAVAFVALGILAGSAGCGDSTCTEVTLGIAAFVGAVALVPGGYGLLASVRGKTTVTPTFVYRDSTSP